MKKIAVGMFYHEANSFNPALLMKEDMVHFEGAEVLKRIYARPVFEKAGYEVIPLLYAVALPNGIMDKASYDYFANRILEILGENRDVDGVFLHLHGSMEVQGLGSGEYALVSNIRKLLGDRPVIGLALDFHANTDERLPALVNVIRNYRTVPHTDQDVTERTVAQAMVDYLEHDRRPTPQFIRLPYAIHPEKALGATWPLNEIFERLGEMEKLEGVEVATLGCGMIWCDCKTLASNVCVTPTEEKYTDQAKRLVRELADYVYSLRDSFEFEQLPLSPHEAARYAIEFPYGKPVYVSDSGDNTTGGAVGDHTIMLREFLGIRDYRGKRVLVTSICDEDCVDACWKLQEGARVQVSVGKDYDENTKAVKLEGTLLRKGNLLGYMGLENDTVGRCVTISLGAVDVCIIDKPGSFISQQHFESKGAGLHLNDYDVVVVKQGYLFAELRKLAKLAILALTPGGTHQLVETLEYHHITPPVYPLHYVEKPGA